MKTQELVQENYRAKRTRNKMEYPCELVFFKSGNMSVRISDADSDTPFKPPKTSYNFCFRGEVRMNGDEIFITFEREKTKYEDSYSSEYWEKGGENAKVGKGTIRTFPLEKNHTHVLISLKQNPCRKNVQFSASMTWHKKGLTIRHDGSNLPLEVFHQRQSYQDSINAMAEHRKRDDESYERFKLKHPGATRLAFWEWKESI